METALILGLLQLVPSIVEAAAKLKQDGSIEDQAAVDAALKTATAAMNAHVDQAIADLNAAAGQ